MNTGVTRQVEAIIAASTIYSRISITTGIAVQDNSIACLACVTDRIKEARRSALTGKCYPVVNKVVDAARAS